MADGFWRGRRVLLTGHTGFKGGWLACWLAELGAEVHGFALPPEGEPNLWTVAELSTCLVSNTLADLRDAPAVAGVFAQSDPEVVFHLAAQPLVRQGYTAPVDTYAVNVGGTVNLLEAARHSPSVRAIVNVTTDKCYENREWDWPYRENDRLGGRDPYSSSKACAELVTEAYRRSFLDAAGVAVATARAGNVIGGGDWAADRLLPDFLRALDAGQALRVRSPDAVRPWQHVLEPLAGYLRLAQGLYRDAARHAGAWNFGPDAGSAWPVRRVLDHLCELVPEARWEVEGAPQPHEAGRLALDSTKARHQLGWVPRWDLPTALASTLDWHRAWRRGEALRPLMRAQIRAYQSVEAGHG